MLTPLAAIGETVDLPRKPFHGLALHPLSDFDCVACKFGFFVFDLLADPGGQKTVSVRQLRAMIAAGELGDGFQKTSLAELADETLRLTFANAANTSGERRDRNMRAAGVIGDGR